MVMNRVLNILIVEAYTDANIGSCALIENSVKIIKSKFKNAKIHIIAQYPEAFIELYGITATRDFFLYPSKQPRLQQAKWLVKTVSWMLVTLACVICFRTKIIHSKKVRWVFRRIQPILESDIVISVGAERLNDKYYKSGPFSLYTLLIAKLLGKKVIIFPSTIGPFFFWWSKFLTGMVLRRLDAVFTRDKASEQIVHTLFKLPPDKVISSVDVAVLQDAINKEEAYRLIGVSHQEPLVGISVLKWGYYKNRIETPYSNYQAYVREMAETANSLIKDYGMIVVFYPTNYRMHACEDDDLATTLDILPLIKNKDRVRVMSELPTPSQLQGMLSCSEINITTRMHACILSTNSYTPTISVNYLFKLKEYMLSLGLSEFSIDIEEFCADRALEAFSRIWTEREKWKSHLEWQITERKKQLWESMERLDDLVQ